MKLAGTGILSTVQTVLDKLHAKFVTWEKSMGSTINWNKTKNHEGCDFIKYHNCMSSMFQSDVWYCVHLQTSSSVFSVTQFAVNAAPHKLTHACALFPIFSQKNP